MDLFANFALRTLHALEHVDHGYVDIVWNAALDFLERVAQDDARFGTTPEHAPPRGAASLLPKVGFAPLAISMSAELASLYALAFTAS